jgi:hypothetical protein
LVKTDTSGSVLKTIPVANHHGDLCFHDGRIYVAVNLGKFNDPAGNADSWVYVYDADDLSFLEGHETQEVFHGAGGIAARGGHFFVVGGLPEGIEENYVYEYDGKFKFVKKHLIESGNTLMGIQTAAFAHGCWWFGCYGNPRVLLKTDESFNFIGKYECDASLGIVGLPNGRLFVARGSCQPQKGCDGSVLVAAPNDEKGLVIVTGCSHPGIVAIAEKAKADFQRDIYMILGGTHLLRHSDEDLQTVIDELKKLGVQKVAATHCSGDKAISMFQDAFGGGFVKMGVGRVVEIDAE